MKVWKSDREILSCELIMGTTELRNTNPGKLKEKRKGFVIYWATLRI